MKHWKKLIPILVTVVLIVGLMPMSVLAEETTESDALGLGVEEGASVTITEQPQNVTVNYPEGATYKVEVDHPENVASYQWYKVDPVGHEFELEGVTAKTEELEVLSTYDKTGTDRFYCIITDKDGNTVSSDKAELKIANSAERKPVLYVLEYAVEPGETLNIADTGLKESGSGSIAFSQDGKEIIFNDFHMTNDWYSAGHICATTFGVELYYLEAPTENDYKVTLNGENVINNIYVDQSSGSGPGLALIVTTNGDPSVCSIEGPGSLTLMGGDYGILSYLSLNLNTSSLTTVPNEDEARMNGIVTEGEADVTIKSGVALNLNVIGTALHVDGGLTLESGSKLEITSRVPYLPADFSDSLAQYLRLPEGFSISQGECIYIVHYMSMKDAEVIINGIGDPSLFPAGWMIASFDGIRSYSNAALKAENSTIEINMSAYPGQEGYAQSFGGIDLSDRSTLNLGSTDLTVNVDSENIYDGSGMVVNGDIYVKDGSNISTNIKTKGRVRGITVHDQRTVPGSGNFEIIDSNITVNTESLNGEVDKTYGIRAGKNCYISLSEGYSVRSTAKGGMAFAALTGESGEDTKGYELGYKPAHIHFEENTDCVLPDPYEINLTSLPGTMPPYDYAETFYSLGESSTPVDDVLITHVETHSIENAVVSGITNKTYTGKAITQPNIKVVLNGKTLEEGTDYKVTYKNNTNAGTATVTIKGQGNYTGSTKANFTIKQVSIAAAALEYKTKAYTGKALKPAAAVKAKVDGKATTLTAGTDYKITYTDNINAGTATVTITGKGNYKGTLTRTFKITQAANSISKITPNTKTLKYSAVKKQAQSFKIKATDKFGASMTYAMDSKTSKAAKKYITISKAGKVTVKKGTPKKTYTVKVKVKAAGTKNYTAKTVTKSIKIIVK